ncbi:MAG TPA: L-threonine 3-dehydrogenase [Anaerolineae bacterium]|nr:L-threonine 3-dehydrogenase [Anaerolineae bacterium]HOQ98005.1 L-threonine 3-dehydrogenase [Anaerolineae bacterium]HPL26678.1 L-threonine 3-dehydrogenase [Anaerolineae bacterium]
MPETMRAIIKPRPGPGLEMARVPIPKIGPREVLVKVRATSICGTDVHIYKWDAWAQGRIKKMPYTIGHEFCGDVVEVGSAVRSLQVGDFVSADSHRFDGTCPVCRAGQAHICANLEIFGVDVDGCFAEYVALPETSAWVNDPDLDPAIASIQDPCGNSVYAVLAEPVAGRSVVVFGDGPTGLFAVGVAKAAGASLVAHVGKYPARLAIGKTLGATISLNITEPGTDVVRTLLDATQGVGVDVVVEMTGSQTAIDQGFSALRKGGRVSIFGIPSQPITLDLNKQIIFKGATIYGINGRQLWQSWYQMAGMFKSGALDPKPVITHRITLDEFQHGFDLMTASDRVAAKIVMYP